MKKILVLSAFALMLGVSNNVLAQYTGPSVATMTVAEASNLRDDTPVVLTGVIEKVSAVKNICFLMQPDKLLLK